MVKYPTYIHKIFYKKLHSIIKKIYKGIIYILIKQYRDAGKGVVNMTLPDMKKILELKMLAMKRCQDRIDEAASRPPLYRKNFEDAPDYGVSKNLKKKYGL